MAITKGQGQKFSKRRTDASTPAIVRPISAVTGISLQGQADIDAQNSEKFYFHVFGNVPSQVLLYIYGQRFHQAFYTEIGEHNHGPGSYATGNVSSGSTSHNHSGSVSIGSHSHTGSTNTDTHGHRIMSRVDGSDSWIDTLGGGSPFYDRLQQVSPFEEWIEPDTHSHSFTTNSTNLGSQGLSINSTSINSHGHTVTSGTSAGTGVTPAAGSVRTSGSPKQYFDDLQIAIDGVDRTTALKTQAATAKFGDGTSGHAIVTAGYELDLSQFITTPGQHRIEFTLSGANNGGKIRWNLYAFQ